MLQTIVQTETRAAEETKPRQKMSATEAVFEIIREELASNGGEIGVAFEVALAHIKAKRLTKDIFKECGIAIVGYLWNHHAGISEQEYPEPPEQIKGVRPKLKRYTPGNIFDKWVPIGRSGKNKLLGDLTVKDLDIIIKDYEAHIEGSTRNKAKYERIRERLVGSKKKHVREALTLQELMEIGLPMRQLK